MTHVLVESVSDGKSLNAEDERFKIMKIAAYCYDGMVYTGVVSPDEKRIYSFEDLGYGFSDMQDLIENLPDEDKTVIPGMITSGKAGDGIDLKDVELLAPIRFPKHDVICLGVNYLDHAEEVSRSSSKWSDPNTPAIYFSKRVNEAVAPCGEIDGHLDIVDDLDFEVELAVIIGKKAYKVSREEAEDYIFGYTVINDVSARKIQNSHKQWYLGKSLDGFTPMGPWIVTEDEIAFPPELDLQCIVNGKVRQSSNTGKMVHKIAQIISELSEGMTLESGTIIATGTPSGVAFGMENPEYLKAGDVVECHIDKIGSITNKIK